MIPAFCIVIFRTTSLVTNPGENRPAFSSTRIIYPFLWTPELRKTALEILNPPHLDAPALDLFYQSRAMMLLCRQVELFCQNSSKGSKPPLASSVKDQLFHAKLILAENFQDPPTIPVLARRCGLNEYTLKKEFKQTFHTTIFTFVRKLKMEQAWTLIKEENHSVSQAANAVGYINVSHFSNAFKKQFSITPGTLKKAGSPGNRAVVHAGVRCTRGQTLSLAFRNIGFPLLR